MSRESAVQVAAANLTTNSRGKVHRSQVASVRTTSTKATAQRLLLSLKKPQWMLKVPSTISRSESAKPIPVTPPKPPPCFICLEDMQPVDIQHPIQCRQCTNINFCGDCMDTLMHIPPTSTDASSILTQIKCPYCRSDLSRTICDTALLRKVDRLVEHERSALFGALSLEVEAARIRQAQWLENFSRRSFDDAPSLDHSSSDPGDGDSMLATHEHSRDDEIDASWSYTTADTTLLGGLESVMTFYEQEEITRCLTSGNTDELARAAKLLYHTSEKVKRKSDALDLSTASTSVDLGEDATASSSTEEFRLLYQLIEAGKKARYRALPPPPPPPSTPDRSGSPTFSRPAPYQKLATQKATQFRTVEREVRRHAAYVKRHPLPTRLPKYCEYSLHFEDSMHVGQIVKSLPFRFCNDVWDGTIMDAFAKCSIHNASFSPKLPRGKNYSGHPKITSTFVDNYKVYQRRPYDDEGVRNILQSYRRTTPRDNSVADHPAPPEEGRIPEEADQDHPRVLVAAVVQPTGTVLPGDVITHLNGTELGPTTVDDLMARIWSLCYASSSSAAAQESPSRIPLQFVLNADRAVAEALKWRAVSQQQR